MASAKERRRRPTHRTSRGSVFFLLSASLARVAARHKNKHLPVCAPSMASRLRVTAGKSQIFLAARMATMLRDSSVPCSGRRSASVIARRNQSSIYQTHSSAISNSETKTRSAYAHAWLTRLSHAAISSCRRTAQIDPFRTLGAAYQIENPAAPGLSRTLELMSCGVDTEKSRGSATLPRRSCPILFDLPLLRIGLVAVGEVQYALRFWRC